MDEYYATTLVSGLQIVAQPLGGVQSAAFAFFLSCGAAQETWEVAGLSHLAESTTFRGTDHRSSRQLNDDLDRLGVGRGSSAGLEMTVFSGVLLGDYLLRALDIFFDVLRSPSFPPEDLEAVRGLQLQEIGQRNDQPAQLAMDRARQIYFAGSPLGNDVLGTPESVMSLSRERVISNWREACRPNGVILAVSGRFEWEELLSQVNRLSAEWDRGNDRMSFPPPAINPAFTVQNIESAQESLCIVFPGVAHGDPHYYPAALTSLVLGGGMNSRLFTEVREKRGLAYSVGARFDGMETTGLIRVYAGTQPERARESVDVIRAELEKLERKGVTAGELELAKTRLKSRLIMNSESTGNRVMAIGRDWWYQQRFRNLYVIRDEIDAVNVEQVDAFLRSIHLNENLGLFALGPLSSAELGVEDRAFEISSLAAER